MSAMLFVWFMSVTHSFLFSNSRVLYSLSQRGYAPPMFARTNSRGVPINALGLSFAICLGILAVHFVSCGDLFLMLAKSSGAFVMTVWIFIIVAHFVMRLKMVRQPVQEMEASSFKAWFFPFSNAMPS